jgi:hypothetical protein
VVCVGARLVELERVALPRLQRPRVEHPGRVGGRHGVGGLWSLLTHVSVVPAETVVLDGLKAKFLMLTVMVLPCAPAVGAKSTRATSESAANRRRIVFLMVVLLIVCSP